MNKYLAELLLLLEPCERQTSPQIQRLGESYADLKRWRPSREKLSVAILKEVVLTHQ